jgi:hypothetical protein
MLSNCGAAYYRVKAKSWEQNASTNTQGFSGTSKGKLGIIGYAT